VSRFRNRQHREVPTLNTSSLPDLIFTILFFFMLVTHIRPVPVMTEFTLPAATELQQLENRSLVIHILIGQKQGETSTDPAIQLNNEWVSLEEMPAALEKLKTDIPIQELDKRVVVMRIDKNTPMGLVNDVKNNLREARLLTVYYGALKSQGRNT
jgi:biopolymer transport protein ExbD